MSQIIEHKIKFVSIDLDKIKKALYRIKRLSFDGYTIPASYCPMLDPTAESGLFSLIAEAILCRIGCRLELFELCDVPEFDRFIILSFFFLSDCGFVFCVEFRFVPFDGVIGGFEFKSVPTPDVSFSDIDT